MKRYEIEIISFLTPGDPDDHTTRPHTPFNSLILLFFVSLTLLGIYVMAAFPQSGGIT